MNQLLNAPVTLDDGITLAINRAADAILRMAGEGVPIERAMEIVRSASCLGVGSWQRVVNQLDERRKKREYIDTLVGSTAHRTYSDY